MARRINFKIETRNACTWSEKFLSIFELLLGNGVVVKRPNTTKAKKYRFINDGDQYDTEMHDLSELFKDNQELTFIELPRSWRNVRTTKGMFKGCINLRKVIIPPTWTNIEDISEMFEGCTSLEEISMPYNWGRVVKTSKAFKNCTSLRKINTPDYVHWLALNNASEMFYGCENLDDKALVNKVSYAIIKDDAFFGTKFNKSTNNAKPVTSNNDFGATINIPKDIEIKQTHTEENKDYYDIKFSGNWSPNNTFLSVFELLDNNNNVVNRATVHIKRFRFKKGKQNYHGVESLNNIFQHCRVLEYIELPPNWGNVKTLVRSFYGCAKLKGIKLPNNWGNITSIIGLFESCSSLEEVIIPDNWGCVVTVGSTFKNCASLKHIVLPVNWEQVSDISNMFLSCTKLTDINTPTNWDNIRYAYHLLHRCSNLNNKIVTKMKNICEEQCGYTIALAITSSLHPMDEVTKTPEIIESSVTTEDQVDKLIKEYSDMSDIEPKPQYPTQPTTIVEAEVVEEITENESVAESVTTDPIVEHTTDDAEKTLYPISFIDVWIPSNQFDEQFELVDINGNTQDIADTDTCHYRLKKGTSPESVVSLNSLFRKSYTLREVSVPTDLPNILDVSNMFEECLSLEKITFFTRWNKIKFVNMLFYKCTRLISVELPSSWEEILNTDSMFEECRALKTTSFPQTWGNVTSCRKMFKGCVNIRHVGLPSTWGNVTDVSELMAGCERLINVPLPDSWDNVTCITKMFKGCINLDNIISAAVITSEMKSYGFCEDCNRLKSKLQSNEVHSDFVYNNFTRYKTRILFGYKEEYDEKLKLKFNAGMQVDIHPSILNVTSPTNVVGIISDLKHGVRWITSINEHESEYYYEELLINPVKNDALDITIHPEYHHELGTAMQHAPTGVVGTLISIINYGGDNVVYTIENMDKGIIRDSSNMFLENKYEVVIHPIAVAPKFCKYDKVKSLYRSNENVVGTVLGYNMNANGIVSYRVWFDSLKDSNNTIVVNESHLELVDRHDISVPFEMDFVYKIGDRVKFADALNQVGTISQVSKVSNGYNLYTVINDKLSTDGVITNLVAEKLLKLYKN